MSETLQAAVALRDAERSVDSALSQKAYFILIQTKNRLGY